MCSEPGMRSLWEKRLQTFLKMHIPLRKHLFKEHEWWSESPSSSMKKLFPPLRCAVKTKYLIWKNSQKGWMPTESDNKKPLNLKITVVFMWNEWAPHFNLLQIWCLFWQRHPKVMVATHWILSVGKVI